MKWRLPISVAVAWSLGALGVEAAPSRAATTAKAMCVQSHDRALAQLEARSYKAARGDFLACASEACPSVVREECAKEHAEVTAKIPSLVFAASQAGSDVTDVDVAIDGVRVAAAIDGSAHEVEPGPHVVRFERAGRAPIEVRVVAREGDKNRVVSATYEAPVAVVPLILRPVTAEPPPQRSLPVLALVIGGLGLGTVGVGSFVRLDANADAAHFKATCAPDCSLGTRDDLSARVVAANILIATGVGLLGAAALTWFLRSR